MNKNLCNVLMFAAGAAIGSLVTWKVVKTKYERIAQEEIDSVKETWSRLNRAKSADEASDDDDYIDEDDEEEDDYFAESDVASYHSLVGMYGGTGNKSENGGEGEGASTVPHINGPYVITPEDFGDGNYDYDMYSLTYYADGVLANDWDEIQDIEETIGEDALEHFGDYAEDIVHVRNERLEAEYEVVRDCRKYTDVLAANAPTNAHAD